MAIPAYQSNSAAVNSLADPCTNIAVSTLSYPSPAANEVLFTITNANSTVGGEPGGVFFGDSGWSSVYSNGSGTTRYVDIFYKLATGAEASTVDVSCTFGSVGTRRLLAVMYKFSYGVLDSGVGSANSGTSTTPSFASLTTNAVNSLAIGIVWANVSTTIGSSTGETGGDWTEAAAEHTSGGNLIQVQTAQMASIGTISGGSATLGTSTTWRTYDFALEESLGKAMIFPQPPMLRHHIFR